MATNALGEPLADAFEIAEGIEFALNIIVAAHPSPPPRPPPLAQSASDADTAALDAFLAYTEFARSLEQGAADAADTVSKYLIERAEQYQPVVEMPTGIDVEIVFLEGVFIQN